MTKFRRLIQSFHKEFDAFIGKKIFKSSIDNNSVEDSIQNFSASNFLDLTYSKLRHFEQFKIMPYHKNQVPSTCDLKVYQDLFIYSFILENIPKGSKILEIGGGDSRVISELKSEYEFWNLDKFEGRGHGPKKISQPTGYTLVKDYIGSFSKALPNQYFDLVFSISTFEHLPTEHIRLERIIDDVQRLLSKNAWSVHCVDALLFKTKLWLHPIITKINELIPNTICVSDFDVINSDNDLWKIPPFAYYTRWFPITKQSLRTFGHPFSLNILWKNS